MAPRSSRAQDTPNEEEDGFCGFDLGKKTLFKLGIVHPSKLELHTETKARIEGAPRDLRSTRQR
jgi:hypothetical protein